MDKWIVFIIFVCIALVALFDIIYINWKDIRGFFIDLGLKRELKRRKKSARKRRTSRKK